MADEQDTAEQLDEDEVEGTYPPDKLLGAQAYGAAGAEPHAVESVAARAAREEPEEGAGVSSDQQPIGTDFEGGMVQDREAPAPAEEAALHVDEGIAVEELDDVDELAPIEEIEDPNPMDIPAADLGEG